MMVEYRVCVLWSGRVVKDGIQNPVAAEMLADMLSEQGTIHVVERRTISDWEREETRVPIERGEDRGHAADDGCPICEGGTGSPCAYHFL